MRLNFHISLLFGLFFLVFSGHTDGQETKKWGTWTEWGRVSESRYRNPILPADFSDIDCIRVGKDYYAISSTFQYSPGMIILHSRDLVHWRIAGHAVTDLTQISPDFNWDKMKGYGKGIWAGTIRYHQGRFYVFFGTPGEGFFMTSAASVEGPWEPLSCLLAEKGWDDCSVFWDEQEGPCFVGTHFAGGYKTYLFRMSEDGKKIDRTSAQLVNEGNRREASKLIKVGEWYYLIFSEFRSSKGRYVMAKRSRRLFGPYTETKQLTYACREAMEPNQGGIVDAGDRWYFLTHHGTGKWEGRAMSLLPVTWINEWPVIGRVTADTIGVMEWEGEIPLKVSPKPEMQRSDQFNRRRLSPQWEWNYQPRDDKWSLTARRGWLRLEAFKPLKANDLMTAGNTLTQRSYRTARSEVTVKMDISGMTNGQKAGLCHFTWLHSAVGVNCTSEGCRLEYREGGEVKAVAPIEAKIVWLRSEWGLDGISTYSYSTDGRHFVPFGPKYLLKWAHYRGDRIGIYCFNDLEEKGYVDVDFLNYIVQK